MSQNRSEPAEKAEGGDPLVATVPPEELKKIGLLGFDISSWGAALALLISIATLGWTAIDHFLVRPEPQLVAPATINLFCSALKADNCATDSNLIVRANPISFLNTASGTHPYVVKNTSVKTSFRSTSGAAVYSITLDWEYFSLSAVGRKTERVPAHPLRVDSGSADWKEIEFYPHSTVDPAGKRNRANFLPYSEFLRVIAEGTVHRIEFEFVSETIYPRLVFETACVVRIDSDFVADAKLGKALFGRPCRTS